MNVSTRELEKTQAWILAGGRGERLHPLTLSRAKPGVSFGGAFRIIDFTLSNCLYSGLTRVSLVTQYRQEELRRYVMEAFNDEWNNSGKIVRSPLRFLPATFGRRYRGTADAIFQNSEVLQSDDAEFVLILPCDHIYSMDYRGLLRQHAETGADLTIAAVEYPVGDASHFGVVEVDMNLKVTGFEEPANPRRLPSNPSLAIVSMGIYVFKKQVLLDALRHSCQTGGGCDFGRDIIPSLTSAGRTYAYRFRDEAYDCPRYWRDIGTIDHYYQASMDLVQPHPPFDPYKAACLSSQRTEQAAVTEFCHARVSSADLYKHCNVRRSVVSPDVQLEDGAAIADSVLMPGVKIGKDARLRRAIVAEGVQIPENFEAGFDLTADRLRYTVSEGGVVVVSQTPALSRPRSCVTRFDSPRGRGQNLSPVERAAA